jgi:4-amino-4-deoxy-L-arabinose transferase-like glycosyltransferase
MISLPSSDILLYIGFALYAASIVLFHFNEKKKLSLFMLFVGCLSLSVYMAGLDHFLHFWDEEFHALVAKNMLDNPFKPMLYAHPVLDYNYQEWQHNSIWLHKQPLFLWQMAISLKLFGINEVAVRLPSAIMLALLVFPIYRIGKISVNERTGYYAAFLFSLGYFIHELAVGFIPTDHNDIAFIFYVACSFWAYLEYDKSKNRRWLVLIGLFVGCAVLVKWLMGLLIFGGWFIAITSRKEKRIVLRNYLDFGLSLLVSIIVFIPWQIFILIKYPTESIFEYKYAAQHYTQVMEDKSGDFLYHFRELKTIYFHGDVMPYIMLLGLVLLFFRMKDKGNRIVLFFSLIAVYVFYTFAKTKMTAFCMIVAPIFYIALASMIDQIFILSTKKLLKNTIIASSAFILIIGFIGFIHLDLSKIKKNHLDSPENKDTYGYQVGLDTKFIKELPDSLKKEDYVLFNCKKFEAPAIMFYIGITTYQNIPLEQTYMDLKQKHIKMAFNDDGNLPLYIQNDTSALKINVYHQVPIIKFQF